MTEDEKKKLIIELINARRRRWGFRVMLREGDIVNENWVSYDWAKDNVEVFEKFLNSIRNEK